MGLIKKSVDFLLKAAEAAGKEEGPMAKAVVPLLDEGALAAAGAQKLSAAERLLGLGAGVNEPAAGKAAGWMQELEARKVLAAKKAERIQNAVGAGDEEALAKFKAGLDPNQHEATQQFLVDKFMRNLKNRGNWKLAVPVVAADEVASELGTSPTAATK